MRLAQCSDPPLFILGSFAHVSDLVFGFHFSEHTTCLLARLVFLTRKLQHAVMQVCATLQMQNMRGSARILSRIFPVGKQLTRGSAS